MREHLTAPLQEGGHGFSDASYGVVWTDSNEFHEQDHNSSTWFSEALLHTHEEPADA